ncbi:hypothetical protein bcgnr5383_02280 [Bacillus cereus]
MINLLSNPVQTKENELEKFSKEIQSGQKHGTKRIRLLLLKR